MNKSMSLALRRRTLLKGSVAISLGGIATRLGATERSASSVTFFDQEAAISAFFAGQLAGKQIDVAVDRQNGWKAVRALEANVAVAGFTRWSDFLYLRAFLEEKGLRKVFVEPAGEGILHWSMERP